MTDIVLRGLFALLAIVAVVAWLVAVVAVFRIPYNTVPGPLKGPAYLRAVDTFRWVFRKDLLLPVLYPENLTPKGRAIRRRGIVAFAVFMLVCFAGVAIGIVGAMRAGGG
jgi:hypothetical protein